MRVLVPVDWSTNGRGMHGYLARDLNGRMLRLSDSSLATEEAVWVGADGHPVQINRAQARQLGNLLLRFAHEGRLPETEDG